MFKFATGETELPSKEVEKSERVYERGKLIIKVTDQTYCSPNKLLTKMSEDTLRIGRSCLKEGIKIKIYKSSLRLYDRKNELFINRMTCEVYVKGVPELADAIVICEVP